MAKIVRNGMIVDNQTVSMSSSGIIKVRFGMFEKGVQLDKNGHIYTFSVDSETQARWLEEKIILELLVSEDFIRTVSYEDFAITEYYIPKSLLD